MDREMDCATHCDDDGAPVHEFRAGEQLITGLHAWQRLGVGQRCETWLAWSQRLWCPVVVKLPRPHQADHPRARRSLCREVAALSGNLHPALPVLYEDGTDAPLPYVVLEHVDGAALDEELDTNGALLDGDVAVLALQVLAALRVVHARGLAHVDIKPDNIVLRDGRPVLLDFGSARRLGAGQQRGKLIGSPGYAAPELEAGEPIGAAMDLFGLGATMYEALTGRAAFDPELPAAQRSGPGELIGCSLSPIVLRLLDPEPHARPTLDCAITDLTELAFASGLDVAPRWASLR